MNPGISPSSMEDRWTPRRAAVALLACLFFVTACLPHDSGEAGETPVFCEGFVVSPVPGEFSLRRSAVTDENAAAINTCLDDLGITNVRVEPLTTLGNRTRR
jgi:hypothetical protein